MVRRREVLRSAIVLAAGQLAGAELVDAAAPAKTSAPQPATPQSAAATGSGTAKPFDYAWLKGQARNLAGNAYQTSKDVLPPAMATLSYDQYQSLRFRTRSLPVGRRGAGLPRCNSSMWAAASPNLCTSLRNDRRPGARRSSTTPPCLSSTRPASTRR